MFLVNEPVDRVTDLQHLFSPGKTRLRKELVVCQRLDDSCQTLLDVYSRGDINVSQLEAKGKKGGFPAVPLRLLSCNDLYKLHMAIAQVRYSGGDPDLLIFQS